MGMTIDRTIEFFNGLECHTPQAKDARDVAIDTMRKYQKIVQIVENVDKRYYGYSTMMDYLHEVVEDGSN